MCVSPPPLTPSPHFGGLSINPYCQVLDTPEPLRNLADLIAAQLEFHKRSYEILSELAPVVDGLQVEQEVCSIPTGS